jgi:hypothetical protein
LLGAFAPKTDAGTMVGTLKAAEAATVLLMNPRLLIFFFFIFTSSQNSDRLNVFIIYYLFSLA